MRYGLTLLEVIIAVAIFGVFTAMSVNSLFGIQGMVRGVASHDIIEDHVQRVSHIMGRDLNNTGWFNLGQAVSQNPQPLYPQVHYAVTPGARQPCVRTAGLVNAAGVALSSPQPRPVVTRVSLFGGGQLPIPSPNQDGHVISTVPPAQSPDFGINADVLYFIRLRAKSEISAVAGAGSSVGTVSFRSVPARMNQTSSAPFIENVIFNPDKFSNPNLSFQPATSSVWESPIGGLTWAQNAEPLFLRICRYYVEPDPGTYDFRLGFSLTGILKISYADAVATSSSFNAAMASSNNRWNWSDGQEICRDVETLVFDTAYTDSVLIGNQVRVKIGFLRRHEQTGALVRRVYENVFVMRSNP